MNQPRSLAVSPESQLVGQAGIRACGNGATRTPCETCKDVTLEGITAAKDGFGGMVADHDLLRSAGKCPLCLLILEAINDAERRRFGTFAKRQRGQIKLFVVQELDGPKKLEIRQSIGSNVLETKLDIYGDSAPFSREDFLSRISSTPDSTPIYRTVNRLIQYCTENHLSGAPVRGFIPARLIDVGDRSRPPCLVERIHLVDLTFQLSYAALSYRRRGTRCRILSMGNIDKFRRSLTSDYLIPKTFLDAIRVTVGLGLRYLWIDSLCVLHSEDHWMLDESENIGAVFYTAFITIDATTRWDVDDGFLQARVASSTYELPIKPSSSGSVLLTLPHMIFSSERGQSKREGLSECFQEPILSRQVLSYRKDQIVFRCCSYYVSEDGCEPKDFGALTMKHLQTTNLRSNWHRLISKFTHSISYDLLKRNHWDEGRQIFGVADIVQRLTGFVYLSGLWKHSMCSDLLWVAIHHNIKAPPTPYDCRERLGCSWTWASIAVPTRHITHKARNVAKLLHHQHLNTFGCELFIEWVGWIMMEGVCRPLTLLRDPKRRQKVHMFSDYSRPTGEAFVDYQEDVIEVYDDKERVPIGSEIFGFQTVTDAGILLTRSTKSGPTLGGGAYIRIGAFKLNALGEHFWNSGRGESTTIYIL